MIRRMGFVCGLLLTLAFTVPAFETHACPDETPSAASQSVSASATGGDVQCPDCGPACANGCCHAPHVGTAAEFQVLRTLVTFETAPTWSHVAGCALQRPAGPDRPPRA